MNGQKLIIFVLVPMIAIAIFVGFRAWSATEALETRIADLTNTPETADPTESPDLTALQEDVAALGDQISALTGELDKVRSELESLKSREAAAVEPKDQPAKEEFSKEGGDKSEGKSGNEMTRWAEGYLAKIGDLENGEIADWFRKELDREFRSVFGEMNLGDEAREDALLALARNRADGMGLFVALADPNVTVDELMNMYRESQRSFEAELAQTMNLTQVQQLRDHFDGQTERARRDFVDEAVRFINPTPESEEAIRGVLCRQTANQPPALLVIDKADDENPFRDVTREEMRVAHGMMTGDQGALDEILEAQAIHRQQTFQQLQPHLTAGQQERVLQQIEDERAETEGWMEYLGTGGK
jgi:hypothetical protein